MNVVLKAEALLTTISPDDGAITMYRNSSCSSAERLNPMTLLTKPDRAWMPWHDGGGYRYQDLGPDDQVILPRSMQFAQ